ncbi:hypothetical protein COOONC_25767 [Cooperia oncophora]
MDSVDSSTTVTLVPAAKPYQENSKGTASTATTARVDRSARMSLQERQVPLHDDLSQDRSDQHQRPTSKNGRRLDEPVESRRVADVKTEQTTGSRSSDERNRSRPSPTPVVSDISMDMGPSRSSTRDSLDEHSILRRVMSLEDQVSALAEENENLTRINDELSKLLVEMADRFSKDVNSLKSELESVKAAQRPDPCNLRVARELDKGCFEIVWDLPMVKCKLLLAFFVNYVAY